MASSLIKIYNSKFNTALSTCLYMYQQIIEKYMTLLYIFKHILLH